MTPVTFVVAWRRTGARGGGEKLGQGPPKMSSRNRFAALADDDAPADFAGAGAVADAPPIRAAGPSGRVGAGSARAPSAPADASFSAAAARAFSPPPAASPAGSPHASLSAGRAFLQASFQQGAPLGAALSAATSARDSFAACWEREKEAAPRDDAACARLAALTGEALLRMATLLIRARTYEGVLQLMYEPGLVLLQSAREDCDALFAGRVAGAGSEGASLVDEVAHAVHIAVGEAHHQRAVLAEHIATLEAKLAELRSSRDNARAAVGEDRWKKGNTMSTKGQAIVALDAECRAARMLLSGMLALDGRLPIAAMEGARS